MPVCPPDNVAIIYVSLTELIFNSYTTSPLVLFVKYTFNFAESKPKSEPSIVKDYFLTGDADDGDTPLTVGTLVVEYVKSHDDYVVSELFEL